MIPPSCDARLDQPAVSANRGSRAQSTGDPARRVVANLDGFDGVHGVLGVPEVGRVYASVTAKHEVAVVDVRSLAVLAHVRGVDYPDGIAYAPGVRRVFVSDERGRADGVIDAGTNAFVTSVPLGGEAGNTVYDPTAKRILVAVHESNELVASRVFPAREREGEIGAPDHGRRRATVMVLMTSAVREIRDARAVPAQRAAAR